MKTKITRREAEVMKWLAKGKTADATAQILGISAKTVESHRSNLYSKLDITSRAQLVENAIAMSIIPNPAATMSGEHDAFAGSFEVGTTKPVEVARTLAAYDCTGSTKGKIIRIDTDTWSKLQAQVVFEREARRCTAGFWKHFAVDPDAALDLGYAQLNERLQLGVGEDDAAVVLMKGLLAQAEQERELEF